MPSESERDAMCVEVPGWVVVRASNRESIQTFKNKTCYSGIEVIRVYV